MAADPQLWILSAGRKGDLDQMVALAKASGLSYAIKRIGFRGPDIPALAPLLLKDRSTLVPPWPKALLCAEATASVIARGLKQKSHGAMRIVCVGRPSGDPARFDLVITSAQYRIPPGSNVVELSMPLSGMPEAEAQDAMMREDDGARPLIALFAGNSAFPDVLDAATAGEVARAVLARATAKGGTLAVQTSPRTSPDVVAALRAAVTPPHRLHVFGVDENRYRSLLSRADEIVVTSDSVSMVADALDAGKPVSVYALPRAESLKLRIAERMRSISFPPVRWLFDAGIIEAPADRRALFERLVRDKRLSWFGSEPPEPRPDARHADLARAAESLRALVEGRR